MLGLILLLVSCDFHDDQADWHDQLQADSPCYRVDLFDGLSEDSTDELRDLYACVDQGNLGALEGLVEALDAPTRSGEPAGIDLARLINHLPATGLDLAAIFDAAVTLLRDGGEPIVTAAELVVELSYGVPFDQLASSGAPMDAGALDGGLVVPALPMVSALATQVQDRDDGLGHLTAAALRASLTFDAVTTFLAASESQEPLVVDLPQDLLADLGSAIEASEQPGNDHWSAASGNSLRDLGVALVATPTDGQTVLEQLLAPADTMLSDTVITNSLAEALGASSRGGHLDVLPSQLALLATTDIHGGSLETGEDSAMVALLRLLHTADREVTCSTLGIEWLQADNMSVWLLELIAEQEPDNVDFLLNVGGFTLSFGELIEAMAGQCTIDSQQFAADAPALERLVDPEVGDLLVVLLNLLQGLQPQGSDSRIPELVELISIVHQQQLSQPIEELLKDLAGTRLIATLLSLVPPLIDPFSDEAWCANGTDSCIEETWGGWDDQLFNSGRDPIDLYAIIDLIHILQDPDDQGRSPLERLRATLQLVVDHPATWELTHNAALLLQNPGSRTGSILAVLPRWTEVDPEWKLLSMSADLLEDTACTTPTLRIAETGPVTDALGATSAQQEGPLPFLSRLVIDETLAELLASVKLILDLLLEARS